VAPKASVVLERSSAEEGLAALLVDDSAGCNGCTSSSPWGCSGSVDPPKSLSGDLGISGSASSSSVSESMMYDATYDRGDCNKIFWFGRLKLGRSYCGANLVRDNTLHFASVAQIAVLSVRMP
jgi:hypothetical protein